MASPHNRKRRTGGGTKYVCLPSINVTYHNVDYRSTTSSKTSYIDGVKYSSRDLFKTRSSLSLYGRAVCTACQHIGKSTTLMVPGNTTCPKTWTMEYTGFLMADSRKKTDFICVDESAEGDGGSLTGVRDIAILDFVTAKWPRCFGNTCGIYNDNDNALRCVVCSL